ncbi:MAG: putative toxin-antitoxin system toxin component, PIN family [Thermodesulfobacteriota bacterium]
MAKIVVDANVLISAAFGGTPLNAVSKAFSRGDVCLSPVVAAEIGETIMRLSKKLGAEKTKILFSLWDRFQSLCRMEESVRNVSVCRDPKDDAYLSLCASIGAEYLITGDKDLLVVDPAREPALPGDLKILAPREYLEMD